ncbi:hypothetical protein, partial [Escherichia coli]|uniref:hypothetical protein n=1 Tax=Escherichia coli TaxID=562 RepID=UPI001C5340B1
EWVHVQLHQQKGMISLSPPTICNSASFMLTEMTGSLPCAEKVTCLTEAGFKLVKPTEHQLAKNGFKPNLTQSSLWRLRLTISKLI